MTHAIKMPPSRKQKIPNQIVCLALKKNYRLETNMQKYKGGGSIASLSFLI